MNKDNSTMKKQRLFYIIGIIVLVIVLLFGLSMCGRDNPGTNEDPLVFEDPVFKQSIATSLGKGTSDAIYPKDLSLISTVQILADKIIMYKRGEEQARLVWMFGEYVEIDDVKFEGVGTMSSLADLKHFPALESLTVAFQKNIDYTTIDNIQNVNYMHLYANELSTLDFVKKSNKLFALNIHHHKLTNLDALNTSTKLAYLSVTYGNLNNINGISDCVAIKRLDFSVNKITDISALEKLIKMEDLYLRENTISDISVLSNLSELSFIGLGQNNISDVSPLAALNKLTRIMLADNPVINMETIDKYKDIIE
jgi:internalin A